MGGEGEEIVVVQDEEGDEGGEDEDAEGEEDD
jgi:hypothetical protein